jgi:hypothetical protein
LSVVGLITTLLVTAPLAQASRLDAATAELVELGHATSRPRVAPRFTLGQIVRDHLDELKALPLSFDKRRAYAAIAACRTSDLGGHLECCVACGFSRPAYNSCGHRSCGGCHSLHQAHWLDKQLERLLPVSYLHVVLTLPEELRSLFRKNARVLYDVFMSAASRSILAVAKTELSGAVPGVTTILHTWNAARGEHPHVHAVVTPGGLAADESWVEPAFGRVAVPSLELSLDFKKRLLAAIRHAHRAGKLDLSALPKLREEGALDLLLERLEARHWHAFAKSSLLTPTQALKYISRYAARVGISNDRILSYDGHRVVYASKYGEHLELPALDFVLQELLHVLPSGFRRIRHSGLLAPGRVKKQLALARAALAKLGRTLDAVPVNDPDETWQEYYHRIGGFDVTACPRPGCGHKLDRRAFKTDAEVARLLERLREEVLRRAALPLATSAPPVAALTADYG